MQGQAGLLVQQGAGHIVQRLHGEREPVLLQCRDQGIVPAVFADVGAVGRAVGRRDLVVVGAFGAHQRMVQAGERLAHIVSRRVGGHRHRPAAPPVLVHGHAQRAQFAPHAFGQQAGLRRRCAGQQ
ncbi:hypothetical protein D9M68_565720 [compost metagenome]